MWKKIMVILLVLTLLAGGKFIYLGHQSRTMQPELGLHQSTLRACPDKPNCVSTSSPASEHKIEAIPFNTNLDQIMLEIETTLKEMQAQFEVKRDNYFHTTFKSSLFGFMDDFEVYVDDGNKLIHIRSASRVGHSDLGANRKRYELFKQKLNQKH